MSNVINEKKKIIITGTQKTGLHNHFLFQHGGKRKAYWWDKTLKHNIYLPINNFAAGNPQLMLQSNINSFTKP